MSTITNKIPVLLVDDRPENLISLEVLLEDMGLYLCKAQSGQDALRLCLNEEFALVLMDVQMPEMDGYETAELMRANPRTRQVPIIFVTAGMDDLNAQFKGYESGAVDFLVKPIEPMFLRSKVKIFTELYLQKIELENYGRLLEARVEERTASLKQAYDQLRQSQKMEAIGTLAGGIAHDFNNILTVISGFGNLTLLDLPPDSPLRVNVQHILRASERGEVLSRSMLSFSRKQNMMLTGLDLNNIVHNVEEMLRRTIGEEIDLTTRCSDQELMILADCGQIEQVLLNLATNARDAMPRGGSLLIETCAHVADANFAGMYDVSPSDRFACLRITDSGCGMDAAVKDKIFEPFFTTKPKERGTGLGMSVVYGIIRQHNSYIQVDSEPGKGTSFSIYMPLQLNTVVRPAVERVDEDRVRRGKGETILVAEDDPAVRQMVETMLTTFGYNIILATDGQEAVDRFRENSDRIRLVLMDVIMPRKTGKDAYDEIRQTGSDVKILFISGYTEDFIKERTDIDGRADLIMKPVNPSRLLVKVREMIDSSNQSASEVSGQIAYAWEITGESDCDPQIFNRQEGTKGRTNLDRFNAMNSLTDISAS
ncbi:blue-light-activated protein [Geobacter sp. OR-1]|uniref:response regulator n=1 Tax=Geobacter sp. OR-1 TaxID=1266765 RepID=UPI00054425F7|nr:response regulator [Geobacter sp. OR-1]GAM09424.1 blue-light-activated protein [Geobacter sp. OR-1]